MEFYAHDENDPEKPLWDKPVKVLSQVDETCCILNDDTVMNIEGLTLHWSLKCKAVLTARDYDGEFEFGLGLIGRAKLFIDGQLVCDNWDNQTKGWALFGRGSNEVLGKIKVEKGKRYALDLVYNNISPLHDYVPAITPAIRLGGSKVVDPDAEIVAAEAAAKAADVAILVVGLNQDWETESFDRTTLGLPLRSNELIERVIKANPNTIVVNQSVRRDLRSLPVASSKVLSFFSRALPLRCLGQARRVQLSKHGIPATAPVTLSRTSSPAS
jgi:beta-glucosidase